MVHAKSLSFFNLLIWCSVDFDLLFCECLFSCEFQQAAFIIKLHVAAVLGRMTNFVMTVSQKGLLIHVRILNQ